MKILIAVDFSPIGKEVAHSGYKMAIDGNNDVVFFHCAPQPSRFLVGYDIKAFISPLSKTDQQQLMDSAKKNLHKVMEEVILESGKKPGTDIEEHLAQGEASEEIIKYAKQNGVGLIYLGYKSYSAIEEIVMGSTAAQVVRYAPSSVWVYRPEK